ncbi:MAG TPA: hypothetical protein VLT90_04225 [Terriglobales bacterium]|nr:hypothetical protein [Terriglobales bacterium]
MTTKTKSAKKSSRKSTPSAGTAKPATSGQHTRWTNPEKRALHDAVLLVIDEKHASGKQLENLKSLLAKIRAMGYDQLEPAATK